MLHSFRKEEKKLKFKIVFQRKICTLCMCFCVCVWLSLCSSMQLAIQWYVITPNQVTQCKDHLDKQKRGEAGSWCRSGSAMLNKTKNQLQG